MVGGGGSSEGKGMGGCGKRKLLKRSDIVCKTGESEEGPVVKAKTKKTITKKTDQKCKRGGGGGGGKNKPCEFPNN